MSINSQKTKFMLVTGNRWRNLVASTTIDFNLNGRDIEHVTDFKLLGVMLGHDLLLIARLRSYAKSWRNARDSFDT